MICGFGTGIALVLSLVGLPIAKSVVASSKQSVRSGALHRLDDGTVITMASDGASKEASNIEEDEASVQQAEDIIKEHKDNRQKLYDEIKLVDGSRIFMRSAISNAAGKKEVIIGGSVFEVGSVLKEVQSADRRHDYLTGQILIEDAFFKDTAPANGIPDVEEGVQAARAALKAAKDRLDREQAALDQRESVLRANRARSRVADLIGNVKPNAKSSSPMVVADAELDRRIAESGREADRKLAGMGSVPSQPSAIEVAVKEAMSASTSVAGK